MILTVYHYQYVIQKNGIYIGFIKYTFLIIKSAPPSSPTVVGPFFAQVENKNFTFFNFRRICWQDFCNTHKGMAVLGIMATCVQTLSWPRNLNITMEFKTEGRFHLR